MSGIFGFLYLDGRPADPAVLGCMAERLAHRGPDGVGTWRGPSVGLGHRMLHTTPESLTEAQPVVLGDGLLAITADARVDNRTELLTAFGMRSAPDSVVSDSELILAAYEKWGARCLDRLLGDFAFAIWDGRTGDLFCARDPMGVKPFYYYRSNGLFVFASEIKGLFCVPEVPRRLNELQVAYHLERIVDDRAITFYEGILRLPAAHSMLVNRRGMSPAQYWEPVPASLGFKTDQDYAEGFKEVFTEAVRCRVRSAYPVSSALSGGLDSSSIACTARRLLDEQGSPPLHTLSAIFPALSEAELGSIDERRFMEAVTALGGFCPHDVRADQVGPFTDLDRISWHLDEPTFAVNLYMHWGLYGAAQQHGARIFLDGIDGDTTVGHGMDRLQDLARNGSWGTFASEVRALAQRHGVGFGHYLKHFGYSYLGELACSGRWPTWFRTAGRLSREFPTSRARLFLRYGIGPLAPNSIVRAWKTLRGRGSGVDRSWVRADFSRRIGLARRRQALDHSETAPSGAEAQPISSPAFQYVLEVADRAAAAFALEPRYPFFDRRLMEFCMGVPLDQKLSDGWTRMILRRAMEGTLPPAVQWRASKQNLAVNYLQRFHGSDRDALRAELFGEPQVLSNYVDLSRLHAAYAQFMDRAGGRGQSDEGFTLYQLATLAHWLRASGPNKPLKASVPARSHRQEAGR
jgi:asparagine synthase (glutamine-hydrolysing)